MRMMCFAVFLLIIYSSCNRSNQTQLVFEVVAPGGESTFNFQTTSIFLFFVFLFFLTIGKDCDLVLSPAGTGVSHAGESIISVDIFMPACQLHSAVS